MGKERVRCFVPEGSQKRKATRVRSLRQRWIVNSVVPIFVLLALIVGGVSLGISNYYYKGMLDGLERQARAQSGAFVDYFMDQGFANHFAAGQSGYFRLCGQGTGRNAVPVQRRPYSGVLHI